MNYEAKLHSPLASPEDIARWDSFAASEYAVPTLLLMENAARAAVSVLGRHRALGPELAVAVLAGRGNNGGDGISLARHLHNLGCRVLLLTLQSPGSYRGICRSHMRMALKAGVRVERLRMRDGAPLLPGKWNFGTAFSCEESLCNGEDRPSGGSGQPSCPGQLEMGERNRQPHDLPDVFVDAFLGAGFKAPLREDAAELVRQVNTLRERGIFIFSLDIPSGLGAMSGRPEPEAVRAQATATFAAAKPGLLLPWAAPYTGDLRICEIGIPLELMRKSPGEYRLINPQPGVIAPHHPLSHKTQKGRVLVIGGSPGLTGAPALSALGAARSGAGLVSVAAPHGLSGEIKNGYPEIMTLPLGTASHTREACLDGGSPAAERVARHGGEDNRPQAAKTGNALAGASDTNWRPGHLPELLHFIGGLGNRSAIVLGPGLGREPYVAELLEAVITLPQRPPLVLDADGLFPFRLDPRPAGTLPLSLLRETDVLTPHPGEMLRLLGAFDAPEGSGLKERFGELLELEQRAAALRLLCGGCPATLLLKGPATLIGKAGQPVSLAPLAEPNLGVGGSGDVLAGIISALLARGIPGLEAACLGAHLHGRAGALTRVKYPAGGNLASDIADQVPEALWEVYGA